MRLPQPFYRLPLKVDAEQLRAELASLPSTAWVDHPDAIAGNSSVRLISVGGGENDEVAGAMQATPHLQRMPYVRQIMAGFGVVWGRSRLMRLGPGGSVPEHADINYHWFNRVRLHIPIITQPGVRFYCGDAAVHMAAGEVWIFDNWRLHRVENASAHERIHLVADTSGSAAFWQLVAQAVSVATQQIPYDPARERPLRTERYNSPKVMPPSEVDLLLLDLRQELPSSAANASDQQKLHRLHGMLEAFRQDWRQLWSLYGEGDDGLEEYRRLRDSIRAAAMPLADAFHARTNQIQIRKILESRVLRHVLRDDQAVHRLGPKPLAAAGPAMAPATPVLARPLIIVSAPRSGSTLLFETLACSSQLCTLGGEAHWLVEGIPALRPDAPGVDSNRLTEAHCTPEVVQSIKSGIVERLQDAQGRPVDAQQTLRLLEKTPKNALRIPFFERLFPDALYIFLWRDPRENISSIMEAWRDGSWVTYPELTGWQGSWSLLLPPGWQKLQGASLEQIAAYQWECTNRTILDDLARLPAHRHIAISYEALLNNPAETIAAICQFAGTDFDQGLRQRTAAPLPMSRYTHTPPEKNKWMRNADAIERCLPSVESTWQRLLSLPALTAGR